MATVAFGVTCSNCRTFVTCVGDDTAAAAYGTCPVCSQQSTYVIDPVALKAEQQAAFEAQQAANIAINEAAAAAAENAPATPTVAPPVTPPAGS